MPKRGTVSVVGHGRAEGTPDVCTVRLVVTVLRPGVTAALADGEQIVRRVREALAAHGVEPRDAATAGVTLQTEEDYMAPGRPLLGYRAEHTLAIVLRDLATAGRVLGEAVDAGGDDVRLQGLDFTISDDTDLRAQAREAAWDDARRAAAQLAELAGRPLGAVRRVEVLPAAGRPMPRGPMRYDLAASAPEVGLEPGGVGVHAAVAVVWELG